MPTKTEVCMIGLIELFRSYASKDGDPTHLNRSELKTLMKTEFATFVAECKDPAELDKFMSALDADGDGQVDFNEFLMFVCSLAMMCNQMLEGATK